MHIFIFKFFFFIFEVVQVKISISRISFLIEYCILLPIKNKV